MDTPRTHASAQPFTRGTTTWFLYLMQSYYAYLLNGLGPAMAFLSADLNLSYVLSSMHLSAFAIGMLVAGTTGDRLVGRFGRRRTFMGGAAGIGLGSLLLMAGQHPLITIAATLIMGTLGTLMLVITPAALMDRYGPQRTIALAEMNVIASLGAVCSPLGISFFAGTLFGWRAGIAVALIAGLLLSIWFRHTPLPKSSSPLTPGSSRKPLPRAYWEYWFVLVLGVATEFCLIFWSASFLEVNNGVARADAAMAIGVFLGAMVVGRLAGSWLVRKFDHTALLLGSIATAEVGFLLHWLAAPVALSVIGLLIAGLGVANFYPLIVSLAVGVAPGQIDQASARASLASGTAILTLPLLLGWLADQIGITRAYGLVALLLVLAAIMVLRRNATGVKNQNSS